MIKKAFVHSFGCQGNLADTTRIKGVLAECGYGFCETPEEADLVLFNTCAVRENAHNKVFGHIGRLKELWEQNRGLIIVVCGCMTAQPQIREHIKKHYPYVSIVFGTGAAHRLPEMLEQLGERKKIFDTPEEYEIIEGLPIKRDGSVRAWIPIMYGCNNFCSYCIVPYVRGRERCRAPDDVLREVEEALSAGFRDITLLGQNVNSYRHGELDFPALLERIDRLEGDFTLRFMTSHPKDASARLFEVIASSRHIARSLHLPVQSGSDEVLKAMNRGYTADGYLELVRQARAIIPELVLTSDIIVGFPSETEADFAKTLELVEAAEYQSMFTFIYSKREGTKAAEMADVTPKAEKQERMARLLALGESISERLLSGYVGKTLTVLTDDDGVSRTEGNIHVVLPSPLPIGEYIKVKITGHTNLKLTGEKIK